MASLLIQEDGSVVANANTFALAADADAYLAARGVTDWTSQSPSTAIKEQCLILAADYLKNERRFQYKGTRLAFGQRMPWPRSGATYRRGPDIPSTAIPPELLDAQCALALRVMRGTELEPDLARGGMVASRSVAGITTSWMANAPAETTIQVVMGILDPILITTSTDNALPLFSQPSAPDTDPFSPGEFNNTGIAPSLTSPDV